MTIVWVIDSLALGGAQKHLVQVVRGLSERNHRAIVFCLNDVVHPGHKAALAEAGAKVRVLGKARVVVGAAEFIIASEARRERADLIVNLLFVSTIVGRVAARMAGLQSVSCLQARNAHYRSWHKWLLRTTAGLDAATIGNSTEALEFAAKHEGSDRDLSYYVPNGIEIPNSNISAPDWTALGWPQLSGQRVIGSVGRLVRQKGYDALLAAFAPLAGEQLELSLLLIGDGPDRSALVKQAKSLALGDRVVFAGERADVATLLPGFALYVQPSRFEGMPNALMEAMAAGLPVVASAVDEIKNLITNGINGWLIPPDNESDLTSAMRRALDNPRLWEQTRMHARQSIVDRFALEKMVEAHEKILQSHSLRRTRVDAEIN